MQHLCRGLIDVRVEIKILIKTTSLQQLFQIFQTEGILTMCPECLRIGRKLTSAWCIGGNVDFHRRKQIFLIGRLQSKQNCAHSNQPLVLDTE